MAQIFSLHQIQCIFQKNLYVSEYSTPICGAAGCCVLFLHLISLLVAFSQALLAVGQLVPDCPGAGGEALLAHFLVH